MSREVIHLTLDLPLARVVDDYFWRHHVTSFPVLDGHRVVGILSIHRLSEVPQDRWATTPVREVMPPIADTLTAAPEDGVPDALDKLSRNGVGRLAVLDGRRADPAGAVVLTPGVTGHRRPAGATIGIAAGRLRGQGVKEDTHPGLVQQVERYLLEDLRSNGTSALRGASGEPGDVLFIRKAYRITGGAATMSAPAMSPPQWKTSPRMSAVAVPTVRTISLLL